MLILFTKNKGPFVNTILSIPEAVVSIVASIDSVFITIPEIADIVYLFTLTGASDSTTDIEIPISSFQARKRNGEPTYLQITIPGVDYAEQISARSNGTLNIDMAYKQNNKFLQRKNIIQADFETIRIDEGLSSQTITLTGYKTESFSKKTAALSGSIYRSVTNGIIRHRIAKPNIDLNPGDTVTIGNDTFDANVISYFFKATKSGLNQNMEIAEA